MITRLVVLGLAVAVAFGVVAVLERRRGKIGGDLPAGITLVTGPDCRLCESARRALVAAAPDLPVRVVDVSALGDPSVRSVPTVVVADGSGEVILRRSGRAAISDAGRIAAAARGVA